jgi:hypothetical protein
MIASRNLGADITSIVGLVSNRGRRSHISGRKITAGKKEWEIYARKKGKRHTTLQTPNKMPFYLPRQNLRLLHQLLSIVLAEVLDLGFAVESEDVGCGF